MIVIAIIGAATAIAFPRAAAGLRQQDVRNASAALATMYNKARAIAMQRGSFTLLQGLDTGNLTILAMNNVTSSWEYVGVAENLAARYGVTLTPSPYTYVWIDGRGLGWYTETSVVVSKTPYADTVRISRFGRVTR
jgi:type II secretory pathway pseudopilin PulG